MAISVADNFSYLGGKPLDGRIQYATVADMKAMADAKLYEGCEAYCIATDKYYKWKSTNPVDETLGKWREIESGGGGGHTIQDDGTDMTARDNLNFVGMEVDDNDSDGSTDVAEHRLTSAEISEMMGGIPNPTPRYPVIFDERGTEYQVGWYILANGTKKPVYQKTVDCGALPNNSEKQVSTGLTNVKVINVRGYSYRQSDDTSFPLPCVNTSGSQVSVYYSSGKIYLTTYSDRTAFTDTKVTLLYTKTTDTPV